MNRRDFIKALSVAGLTASVPTVGMRHAMATNTDPSPFTGTVLITINMRGGWDHSSFSDPRENTSINHWAETEKAGVAGNLRYAPMAENAEFFDKYYQNMLVINGVDLQTNGHGGARQTHHSGTLSSTYPALNALYAAIKGQGLPMSWLFSGGLANSGNIQPFSRLPSDDQMRQMADPNRRSSGSQFFRQSDMSIIERYRLERLQAQRSRDSNLPYHDRKLGELYTARTSTGLMGNLDAALPEEIDTTDLKGTNSRFVSEIHRVLVAVKAGVCVTASLDAPGSYDSHRSHDMRHTQTLTAMVRGVDYLWTKAQSMGIADRLVVHLASDVGRTPHYNGNDGKDHWSSGSTVLMAKNKPWTNRVVGMSGSRHQKVNIDPNTLQPAEGGVRLRMPHVHRTLHQILGIQDHELLRRFAFDAPSIDLLNPETSSPLIV